MVLNIAHQQGPVAHHERENEMITEATVTEVSTIADIDALFAEAAARTVEFETIAEARDYIFTNGLPTDAFFPITRDENGMVGACGVYLP